MLALRMLDRVRMGGRPWAYEALPHGLELLLERLPKGFRLTLARRAPARPSDTEESVLRKSFRVPEWGRSERIARWKNDELRNLICITWETTAE